MTAVGALLGLFGLLYAVFSDLWQNSKGEPPQVTTLLEQQGELQKVSEELTTLLDEVQRALREDKGQSDLLSDLEKAIKELSHGRPESAERLLRRIVENESQGEAPQSRAAEVLDYLAYRTWGLNFTVDSEGNVVIADHITNRILRSGQHAKALTVLAGNGTRGFEGDGGQAVDASLAASSGPAFGPDGKLYFADQLNHRIRRIDLVSGIIDTVAGVGPDNSLTGGFTGDGGLAVGARLNRPGDVTFDIDGNLYITDVSNGRIRRIDGNTGIITTVAGSDNSNRVSNGDGGLATEATMDRPQRARINSRGDIIIAEGPSNKVRIVDAATGIISTLAGTGTAGYGGDGGLGSNALLDGPYGIAVDAFDHVYIADYRNCRIRKVDALTGIISTFAGNGECINAGDGGPLRAARFMNPHKLVFSNTGDLYVGVKSSTGQAIRVIQGASKR